MGLLRVDQLYRREHGALLCCRMGCTVSFQGLQIFQFLPLSWCDAIFFFPAPAFGLDTILTSSEVFHGFSNGLCGLHS